MTTWFDLSTPSQTERLEEAWPGAPVEQQELCSMLLGIAKEQVIAYAPAPDAEVGEVIQGPITVARRNLAIRPNVHGSGFGWMWASRWGGNGGTVSNADVTNVSDGPLPTITSYARKTWTVVGNAALDVSFNLNRGGRISVTPGQKFTVSFWWRSSWNTASTGNAIFANFFNVPTGGTPLAGSGSASSVASPGAGLWQRLSYTFAVPAGATHLDVWHNLYAANLPSVGSSLDVAGMLVELSPSLGDYFDGNTPPVTINGRTHSHSWDGAENASTSVETYRPDVFVPSYPDRLVYAQLQQAQNLWNAGQANPNGDIGPDSFTFTPRPLDKTIRSIIRPSTGAASVF